MLSSHALSTLSLAPPSCRPCWQVGTFKGHRAKVRLLLVLGECLLSVDEQRHVLLWPVGTLKGHKAKIKLLLVFGEYLISVDENRHVLMWPVRGTQRDAPKGEGEEGKGKEGNEEEEGRGERGGPDGDGGVGNEEGKKPGGADQEGFVLEPLGQFQLPEGFNPTGVIHPDTYLNKLLFASEDGRMQLWNVNSRKLLYEFKGWGVGITALVGSPALDTAAVGCSDGKVHVHNIRLDRPVVDFTHAAAGAVTSLAFNSDGPPLLAVGGMGGAISVWDLTNRRLHSIIPDAHDGRVAALSFLVNEPLLLSAGADNSLKPLSVDPRLPFFPIPSTAACTARHQLLRRLKSRLMRRLKISSPSHLPPPALHAIIPDAHDGRVAALSFFVNEPLLLCAGADNSLKLHARHLHSIIPDTHDGRVAALSFLVNEPLLLSAGFESTQKQASLFCSLLGQTTASRGKQQPQGNANASVTPSLLQSSSVTSPIAVCDLTNRRLHSTIPGAHDGTTGTDATFSSRSSHHTLSHSIPHHHHISPDLTRSYRIAPHPTQRQDQQSRELSQGNFEKRMKKMMMKEEKLKLSKVVCIDAAEVRERDWANVVTCHEGNPAAFVWELRNFVIGKLRLVPPGIEPSPATSARHRVAYQWRKKRAMHPLSLPPPCPTHQVCAASMCGNFALVGTSSGHLHLFHLQSARHRVAYQSEKMQYSPAHGGMVTGAAIDALNRHSISCGRDGRVKSPAHGGMVTGAAVDALNGHSINGHSISCGRDGHVKVWYLKSGRLRFDVNVGSPIVKLKFHHGNNLAAIACENFTTYIFDAEAGRLVRRFPGHEDRITAVEVSPDGRWLLTSAMDLTVRTWHVVSGRPLDAFQVPTAVVGLSMSPTSDLLATIHLNRRGIYLWANKAMYSGIDDSDLLPVPLSLPAATATDGTGTNSSVPAVQMPILIGPNEGAEGEEEDEEGRRVGGRGVGTGDVAVIAGEGGGGRAGVSGGEGEVGRGKSEGGTRAEHWTAEEAEREARDYETSAAATAAAAAAAGGSGGGAAAAAAGENQQQNQELQLQVPGLISRAMLPRSQWVNLVMLDVIKERNRPIQPPKKPEQAPFFLPSVPTFSGAIHFAPPQAAAAVAAGSAEPAGSAGSAEPTGSTAAAADGVADSQATALLKVMSPSAVDLELRAIEIVDDSPSPADLHRVALFMSFLEGKLRGSCDFELLQAVTHRFLAIHGSAISSFPQLRAKLPALKEAQASSWQRLDELFQSIRCVVDFIASS
ncbi:unnamed protein product [Closterium sp. NIES-65]|nr:unnamed protein product [Closterium sp. NIES-65]